MPLADVHGELRLLEEAGVASLQRLVEEAHDLVAPLDPGLRVGLVRPGVVPGPDDRPHRRLHVLEHARDAVAVAVVPAADQEGRDADRRVVRLERGAVPERALALLLLVGEHVRRPVEALREERVVDLELRRGGDRAREVVAHLPRIDVHHAVDEVDVVLVEVVGGVHRHDGLERRRVPHRHLDRVEAAPRDPDHAHVAVRERLAREPRDHVVAVAVLDLAVLVRNHDAVAPAGAADVHARHDVAAPHEVAVEAAVGGPFLVLAIRQVLEHDGEAGAGFAPLGRQRSAASETPSCIGMSTSSRAIS